MACTVAQDFNNTTQNKGIRLIQKEMCQQSVSWLENNVPPVLQAHVHMNMCTYVFQIQLIIRVHVICFFLMALPLFRSSSKTLGDEGAVSQKSNSLAIECTMWYITYLVSGLYFSLRTMHAKFGLKWIWEKNVQICLKTSGLMFSWFRLSPSMLHSFQILLVLVFGDDWISSNSLMPWILQG